MTREYRTICAICYQVRDQERNWIPRHIYEKQHPGEMYSQGICNRKSCNVEYMRQSGVPEEEIIELLKIIK